MNAMCFDIPTTHDMCANAIMLASYEDVLFQLETEMELLDKWNLVGDTYLSSIFCSKCSTNASVAL